MRLIKWSNEKIKRMDFWDMACIKWASIVFGIIIGAYIAGFVKNNLIWFIVLFVLLAVKPVRRIYKK